MTVIKKKKGFTVIELLVVLAIIGLIATLALVAVKQGKMKSNDAKRKTDLKQLYTALELYYDKFGYYPPETTGCDTSMGIQANNSCCTNNTGACSGWADEWPAGSNLYPLVTQNLMTKLPVDPINKWPYYYRYEQDNAGQGTPACAVNACRYILLAYLEKEDCIYIIRGGTVGNPVTAGYNWNGKPYCN